MSDTPTSFYLADWHVDTQANRLRRGDTEVRLESKVMAVLHHLAQHPGELVTREGLEAAIWGRTVVGYDALTRCIAEIGNHMQGVVVGRRHRTAIDLDAGDIQYVGRSAARGHRYFGFERDQF